MLQLRMGQALNPTDPEGHIQLGKTYRELGEYENAIESFQNAIALDDEHHHAYNNLGLVYTDISMFALAIEMFLAALELSPGNPAFYNNLGYAYDMTDQFEEALAAFQNAIESEPTFADAYYNMANVYLHREMYQDAIQNYEAALEIEEGTLIPILTSVSLTRKAGNFFVLFNSTKKAYPLMTAMRKLTIILQTRIRKMAIRS